VSQDLVSHILTQWKAERPDLDSSPIAVVARIHRLGNYLRREILAVYAQYGLGEGEFDVLATLRRNGEPYAMLPTQLSQQTMVTSGGMTKQVDRLEKAGLVVREASPHDRRKKSVRLTAKGLELIDQAFEHHMSNEKRLLAALPSEDRDDLTRILSQWMSALEQDVSDFSAG